MLRESIKNPIKSAKVGKNKQFFFKTRNVTVFETFETFHLYVDEL